MTERGGRMERERLGEEEWSERERERDRERGV